MSEQLDKLKRIRSRCVELLALAEKRTPGKWKMSDNDTAELAHQPLFPGVRQVASGALVADCFGANGFADEVKADAAFIASCAGAAEAGWRSTIGIIDLLLPIVGYAIPNSTLHAEINAILTAWEGLL